MKPRYIAHTGKKQPVEDAAVVSVVFRGGPGEIGPMTAKYWADGVSNWWVHSDTMHHDEHIIAYRVIEQEG
jgi:hypothetical protein